MNKLQIVEEIFGTQCFTPYIKISGDREYLSARNKNRYFADWSAASLECWQMEARAHGYRLGIDFILQEITLQKI